MKTTLTSLISAFPIILAATSANAQLVDTKYDAPTLDRWMYPFNGSPGTRFEIATFGAVDNVGFDDHDAQVLLGFDTSSEYTPSLGSDQYRILDITVTMTVANDDRFTYDATFDPYTTYGVAAVDPDDDLGRPLNLFLPAYRDGYDQSTYLENTVFGLVADVPPAQGLRHAFAAIFDRDGNAQDISNNIKDQFEAVPLAIGTTDTVTPGDLVPADTVFTFTFSPCDIGSQDELARMLDRGEVRFMMTSLSPASGGPGGGGGGDGNYPSFYSRENPIAQILGYTATLDINAWIGSAGDFNGDGVRDFFDISGFLSSFSSADPSADINGDCQFDFFDISAFLSEFTSN